MKPQAIIELQTWVDGELDADHARRVEARVAADAESRTLAGNLRSFRQLVREHEPARAMPVSRDFYWSRIRREIERESATPVLEQPARRPAWIPWLAWLVPAAAVVVAGLFLGRDSGQAPAPPGAMVGHRIEVPDTGMSTLTFYSAKDAVTVVWVSHVEML